MKYRVITGTLKARTALHVGSGEGNALADALLRRDAQGNWLIPGTAIAGQLRALLTRLAPRLGEDACVALWPADWQKARRADDQGCGCAVCRLMGDVEPSDAETRGKRTGVKTMASRVLVFNALWKEGAAPVIRDGVGIDRATGAAARQAQAKFDLEVLPAGTCFDLRIELREPPGAPDESAADERLLATALAEWQAGRLWLGGDSGRGLGAFDLCDLHYRERDLDDSAGAGLMAHLRAAKPWETTKDDPTLVDKTAAFKARVGDNRLVSVETAQAQAVKTVRGRVKKPELTAADLPLATGWAAWELTLQAEGPLLTNDATAAGLSGFDHAPLLATLGDWTQPVLAGVGLRGVLRAQAERIARTLVTQHALQQQEPAQYFLRYCPACDPLMQRPRSDQATALPLESCDSLLRYNKVTIPVKGKDNEKEKPVDENDEIPLDYLCPACQLFGNTRRGSRLRVEDAPFVGGTPSYKMLDFLAVDRFTGGGAEHLKFDALALWKPTFTLRLWLDDPAAWELGWLTLTLRDLAEGWLRVGYGAAKGFGKVTVSQGTVRIARLPDGAPPEQTSVYTIESFALNAPALRERQRGWVEAFQQKLKATESYRQPKEMALGADSYFGKVIARLYPVMEGGV